MTKYFLLLKDEPPIQTALAYIRAIGVANHNARQEGDTTNYKMQWRRGLYPASYRIEMELSADNLTAIQAQSWYALIANGGLLYKTAISDLNDPIIAKWMAAQLAAFDGDEMARIAHWQDEL